jgi:hypothetical protein
MAYENSVGAFFVPAGTAPLGVETVSAAIANHGEMICIRRCIVKKLMFVVTVAVVGTTTAPVVTFAKRPTPGSDTGKTTIGTLTLPDGTAIGKVLYKKLSSPVVLNVGDALLLDHTVQAVGGSVAGAGYYAYEIDEYPEHDVNSSDMVASA